MVIFMKLIRFIELYIIDYVRKKNGKNFSTYYMKVLFDF